MDKEVIKFRELKSIKELYFSKRVVPAEDVDIDNIIMCGELSGAKQSSKCFVGYKIS